MKVDLTPNEAAAIVALFNQECASITSIIGLMEEGDKSDFVRKLYVYHNIVEKIRKELPA